MKKIFAVLLGAAALLGLTACGDLPGSVNESAAAKVAVHASASNESAAAPDGNAALGEGKTDAGERRIIKLLVSGREINIALYDTPTANALYEKLPLDLKFEDFNGTEKISYLSQKLSADGEPDGCDPNAGDFCIYAPWGNLSIFYKDFRYSRGLIMLGHVDSGMDVIMELENGAAATLTK